MFSRSKLVSLAHAQGEGITKDMSTKRQGSLGAILEAGNHIILTAQIEIRK